MQKYCKLIAQYLKRLYNKGLTTCYGGNISIRYNDGYYISETTIDKSLIKEANIAYMDYNDISKNGIIPSSEFQMHRMIYETRADINSIIHAHPPSATAYALSGNIINSRISSEMFKNLGDISVAKYAKPGTIELAEEVCIAALKSNTILMENHGVVVLAKDIHQAYYMIELIEQLAYMSFIINSLGTPKKLSEEQLYLLKKGDI